MDKSQLAREPEGPNILICTKSPQITPVLIKIIEITNSIFLLLS